MDFLEFRDKIIIYINRYMEEIKTIGKTCNYDSFRKRVDSLVSAWNKDTDIIKRQITETFNEVCIIHYLSKDCECINIVYEQCIGQSMRSIDIVAEYKDKRFYLDIKTIHPDDIDKWEKYKAFNETGRINGNITLYEDGMGGVFWHHMEASRTKFIDYSAQLEDKIREHNKNDGFYFMVFCGNGFDWHIDQLEDFIEYYLTGHFIGWDNLRSMSEHYMTGKNINFNKTIVNFTVLERSELSKDYKVIPFVRMENQFRNYI